ncbi:hypothetical protein [Arthrobacter sp. ZGTC131]|uniref:biotin synthase auxiliary protein BsaP n=1 Tax=Arthrobacter sp. ZGTC131 TaxID=2058898 RepID=UPI0021587243|nr:hypothetical protein [Arthrobacter sp. ZGTC131]
MKRAITRSGAPAASSSEGTASYCGHCGELCVGGGERDDGGEEPPSNAHRRCGELLVLEPPRYCSRCRRRLKVQVNPLGWTATCSRHGVTRA